MPWSVPSKCGYYSYQRLKMPHFVTPQFFVTFNSNISPGWQSNGLHVASTLKSNRFRLAVFQDEILAIVIPTFSVSLLRSFFLTEHHIILTMIPFLSPQTVKSFSVLISIASCKSLWRTAAKTAITIEAPIITNPSNARPGASSHSAIIKTNGKITTYKPLIAIAQFLIFLRASNTFERKLDSCQYKLKV